VDEKRLKNFIIFQPLLVASNGSTFQKFTSENQCEKRTFAMEAAPAAIPPNPKIAAITAIIKNPIAQRNIVFMVFG
jgi:hypothetical protein